MPTTTKVDLESVLAEIRSQLLALTERIERIEARQQPAPAAPATASEPAAAPEPPAPVPAPAAKQEPVEQEIPEEDLMAISAALAAYFGVRVRARQIRLISSPAWAQQGRVSIQASHQLVY